MIIFRGKGIWARPKENLEEERWWEITEAQLAEGKEIQVVVMVENIYLPRLGSKR